MRKIRSSVLATAVVIAAACSSSAAVDGAANASTATSWLPPTATTTTNTNTTTVTTATAVLAVQPASFDVERVDDQTYTLTYADIAGADRSLQIEIRRPIGGPRPAPVVVWSHGGSTGKKSTARVGQEWGQRLTTSGFAFVAIAHTPRDQASREQLCAAIEFDDCTQLRHLDWDRPADVSVVVDWIESIVAEQGVPLDLDRVVYAGHSAGAKAVLRVAGAEMPLPATLQPTSDPRFAAFIAASPPSADLFAETGGSLDGIDRPLLMLSGAGDTTSSTQADDRRATYELLPAGPFALIWVDDENTRHTTFDLSPDSCRRAGGTADRCTEIVNGIGRSAVAFLQEALTSGDIAAFATAVTPRMPSGFELVTRDAG